jgi:hypothetical protein
MRKQYCFRHEEFKERKPFEVFDFETSDLGGELLACSYMMEGQTEATYITGRNILQTLFDVMAVNHQYIWYAHNAQYELLYFIEAMRCYEDRVSIFNRSDRDVFMIHFSIPEYGKNAVIEIRDSLAVYPESLASFTKVFSPDKAKLSFDFDNVIFDPSNPDHIEYSKRDSEALLASLLAFDDSLMTNFGVHIQSTTAATAMAAWQATIPDGTFYNLHEIEDDKIREAYYGGLVFLTDTNVHKNAKSYDINSSYPSNMLSDPVPLGKPMTTKKITGDLGIYDVTVTCPNSIRIPCLASRSNGGIIWQTGTFRTWSTSCELEFAIKQGYTIDKVHEGLVWKQSVKPFTVFINKCKSIRKRYKGTGYEKTAKLMQNSLYGRFGSRRQRKKFYRGIPKGENELEFLPWGNGFYYREEEADTIKALPQWAVFITARSRLLLLEAAYSVGPENCLYGDTDSITLKQGHSLPTGDDYGQFKLEKEWLEFRARAPKVYSGKIVNPLDNTVEMKGAVKGIPKKYWESQDILAKVFLTGSGTIEYKSLERLITSMKTGYVGVKNATRSISQIGNCQSWRINQDGTVRPVNAQEENPPLVQECLRASDA